MSTYQYKANDKGSFDILDDSGLLIFTTVNQEDGKPRAAEEMEEEAMTLVEHLENASGAPYSCSQTSAGFWMSDNDHEEWDEMSTPVEITDNDGEVISIAPSFQKAIDLIDHLNRKD